MKSLREELFAHAKKKYKVTPEHLWVRYPNYAVLRHGNNQKWFGLVMDVPGFKLGLDCTDSVDILDVKLSDPLLADFLKQQEGYFPGYHLSKGNWISILLDGTIPMEEIVKWLEESYLATASKETRQKLRPPKDWIVPSNPKYYDVQAAFAEASEINWKQGRGIKKGDTVFLYLGAPVSAVLYQCLVTQTDMPCRMDKDGPVRITSLMRLKLLRQYPPNKFTFAVLEDYGVHAVRGPRGIPEELSASLRMK